MNIVLCNALFHSVLVPAVQHEKLHKRIVRIMTKSTYTAHTNPLFRTLNCLKLNDICTLEIAKSKFMYCYKINLSLHSINHIPKTTHNHSTRLASNMNYVLPIKQTECGKISFAYNTHRPTIWQEVPTYFKSLLF